MREYNIWYLVRSHLELLFKRIIEMTDITFFISHAREDSEIASALQKVLHSWGVNPKSIYLDQSPTSGPAIGESIDKELAEALSQTKVFFLIYTFNIRDWRYPFYELGLATDPKKNPDTKLVIIQCGYDQPNVHKHVMRVAFRDGISAIEKFTSQFHLNDDFIPGFGGAWAPDTTEEVLKERYEKLHESLSQVIPKRERKEKYRWPYLKISIPEEQTKIISEIEDEKDAEEKVKNIILSDRIHLIDVHPDTLQHFYLSDSKNKTFGEMTKRWNSNINKTLDFPKEETWLNGFSRGIWRGIRDTPPVPIRDAPLQSARDGSYYHLLVSSIIELPNMGVEVMSFMIETSSEPGI